MEASFLSISGQVHCPNMIQLLGFVESEFHYLPKEKRERKRKNYMENEV